MEPTTTAALIAAAGSLLGGMLGSGGGMGSMRDYSDAAQGTIAGRLKAAKLGGIHPLYALGAATPGPAQVIPGQSKWGSIAKDVANAFADAQLAKAQVQQNKASTDLLRAQTAESQARTAEINKSLNSEPNLTAWRGRDLHTMSGDKIPNKWITIRDKDGSYKKVLNPDIYEYPEGIWYLESGRDLAPSLMQSGRRHSPTRSRGSRGTRRYPK